MVNYSNGLGVYLTTDTSFASSAASPPENQQHHQPDQGGQPTSGKAVRKLLHLNEWQLHRAHDQHFMTRIRGHSPDYQC